MTVNENRTADATGNDRVRDDDRQQLAEVLDLDPASLADAVRLRDDLALDSLAMMSLLTWLETRGVQTVDSAGQPVTVGDVLALLEHTAVTGVSVRVAGSRTSPAGPADVTLARWLPPRDRGSGFPEPGGLAPAADGVGLAPTLSDATVRLTPVGPDDVRFLYSLAVHPQTCFRWRYRGVPPPVERFAADLWSQVLVQFVVRRTENQEPVGHVVAYGAEIGHGHTYIGAVFQPAYTGTGLAARAAMMFIRYLFHAFPLRKLYMEVPEFNWPQLRSGENQLFRVEGRLRDHEHFAGRYWDRLLCAIYRDGLPAHD